VDYLGGVMMWKNYFKAPFKNDDMGCYLWDNNNQMTIMYEDCCDNDLMQTIEDILNDKPIDKSKPKIVAEIKVDGCDVFFNDIYVFCVRGWGYLTGSLNLNEKTACEIQDSMIKHIISKLKGEQ
jgi:hypothetical protein